MAKARGNKKGSPFEREISGFLSKWWTGQDKKRIFWRSASSGGMATNASQLTRYQHGDITAIDPIGLPFLDLFTIELKKGYPDTVFDLLLKTKNNVWKTWIPKAEHDRKQNKSKFFMIIHKQDHKKGIIVFSPAFTKTKLFQKYNKMFFTFYKGKVQIVGCLFDDFFSINKRKMLSLLQEK